MVLGKLLVEECQKNAEVNYHFATMKCWSKHFTIGYKVLGNEIFTFKVLPQLIKEKGYFYMDKSNGC
jgi:hypothetical protein